jgi:pimeloyl-ACP methyl ester carboxylesterase
MMEFPNSAQFFFLSRQGKIHYRGIFKDGAPMIIIVPGFTMPSGLYWPMAEDLHRAGFSVAILDYWGRGHSDGRNDGNLSLGGHIEMVRFLVTHLQISKCSFIGVSYGAAVVAGVAISSPGLVHKIAFVSPLGFMRDSPSSLQKFVLGTPYLGPLVLRLSAPNMVRAQIAQQLPRSPPSLTNRVSDICLSQFRNGYNRLKILSRAIGQFDEKDIDQSMSSVAELNLKFLILMGSEDTLVNVEESRGWWSRWGRSATIHVEENCGHLLFLEKPQCVCTLLTDFFAS